MIRDEKGRFVADCGPSHEEAVKRGHAGGKAKGESYAQRRNIAEAVRMVLDEKAGADGNLTRQQAIVAKVIRRLYDEGDIRDLKVLQDILGESVQNVAVSGLPTKVVVSNEKTAQQLRDILDRDDD